MPRLSAQGRRPLGLHQITALGADPVELVRLAAAAGCEHVCIFTNLPPGATFPCLSPSSAQEMAAELRQSAVAISNIEYFRIEADTEIGMFRAGLELGASLGAARAVVHVHDPLFARAADRLGATCDLAGELGLSVGLEFPGFAAGCNSLSGARALVAGVGRPNLGIAVDALHWMRTGGDLEELRAVPAADFAYAQLCDGIGRHRTNDYRPEAMDRLLPGEGEFPLPEFIDALPHPLPIDVEVPRAAMKLPGWDMAGHVVAAVRAARALLDDAAPSAQSN